MILVTGANGFVGRALMAETRARRIDARGAVREGAIGDEVEIGNVGPETDWTASLRGVACVIHTAARVHVMRETAEDPLRHFRAVNVEGTLNLARQAVAAGSRRFVFVSTIKVNGESTSPGRPFTADDKPHPADAYAISKFEAEKGLRRLAGEAGIEVVIVRPPLVYGPGVKGNFARLVEWLAKGLPLPLGAVDNRRSLVAIENLVDLILSCADHPAAADRTWLVSDGEDLSTPSLLRRLGDALGKRAHLVPVPTGLLRVAAAAVGRRDSAERLLGSLQLDISPTRDLLDWNPPLTVDEGLQRVAHDFLMRRN